MKKEKLVASLPVKEYMKRYQQSDKYKEYQRRVDE
jgi:hypothetical protein